MDSDLDDTRYEHHLKHRGRFNQRLSQLIWLIIFVFLFARAFRRVFDWACRRCRLKRHSVGLFHKPTPSWFDKFSAFFKAISSLTLPRFFPSLIQSPLSFGRIFLIASYTCIVGSLIVSVDAPKLSPHFVDDVAFRAAWITLTQVPLVYFLSTKRGPINFLAALSYERINWIHRWVGRVLFLSATTHMVIMKSSISMKDILQSHDNGMAVVRYGIGAYSILTWIAISSVFPIRRWSYRLFYINHCLSTLSFLFIIFQHVPAYARAPIYLAVTFLVIDKSLCCYAFLWHNISIRPLKRKFSKFREGHSRQMLAMGYPVKMMAPFITNLKLPSKESTTTIRMGNLPFSWKPGQHVRMYLPRLGAFEMHPFTPATCSVTSSSPLLSGEHLDVENNLLLHSSSEISNEMVLMVRAHSGLTKRLLDYHSNWLSLPCPNASAPCSSLTAYIDGPYGSPPDWEKYEKIVLVATSTGVSFILSIMDYLEQLCFEGQTRLQTKQIRFIWVMRHIEPQFESTVMDLLLRHSTTLRESGIGVNADFYVTCPDSETGSEQRMYDPFAHLRRPRRNYFSQRPPLRIRNPDTIYDEEEDDDEYDDAESMKELEPIVDEMDCRSSFETDVSSTLIDEEERRELPSFDIDSDSDSDSMLEELNSSCWSRLPSFRVPGKGFRVLPSKAPPPQCQCLLVQCERRKWKSQQTPHFVTRFYGSRPNLPYVLSSAAPHRGTMQTMIAVCANEGLERQVKNTVARMNFEFTLGKRERGVDVFVEGFS